ncbi:CbtA family protein [Nocardioides panacis]|uniref:CbtA family protein n=1 Tax=Nocardioides panacis TaxID=2849501 RepID=A0A975SWE2_9ACTN|nr:CbtA family protein [Nocardioides panacis]QWZ06534.1 CbtA family protein [Nocardioides panacis]
MRFPQLLRAGAISGAAAGVAAALVMWLHTEPVIRRALAVEDARAHAGGAHHHEEELVSRTAQVFFGACTAAVAGLLFGLVFAVVFAKARHRLPGLTDQGRALWLGALGFGVFTLLPALAVPANPPAVGDPATVTQRTLTYVLTVLVGLLVIGLVSGLDHLLGSRGTTPPVRLVTDLVGAAVLVVVALWLLPASPDRIPADVPADLIWDFRVASLAQLGTMWLVLAALFGLLVSRRAGVVAREAEPVLTP